MNLSKIEIVIITGFISLNVLLFGSWILKYYMNTHTIFSAIGLCFIGILLIVWQNVYRTRLKSKRHTQNKTSIALSRFSTEIKNDKTAINILCAIKTLQNDYQENSEILGQLIRIPESEISKHSGVSLGMAQFWIGKLTKAKFLEEGFGGVYGVGQLGLDFLYKRGKLK